MIFYNLLHELHKLMRPIRDNGNGNTINIGSKYSEFLLTINGNNNSVFIGKNCILRNCTIALNGDNNHVIMGDNLRINGPMSITMDGNSTFTMGDETGVRGVKFMLKNNDIEIGRDCMFSFDIVITNHDSHHVYADNDLSIPINTPQKITIGRHVWIGRRAIVLKGASIGDNSIVAAGAIVTRKYPSSNVVIAGNPAQIVKTGINWKK